MNLKPFRKVLVGCAAALTAAGIAFGGMTSASADPITPTGPRVLNGGGSDTSQDVVNGIANVAKLGGAKYVASWDATGSPDPIVINGKNVKRPNGSSNGLRALSASINSGGAWTWNSTNIEGTLQFARSSSRPSVAGSDLTFVPFARDAVTYATAATSVVPSGIPLDHTPGSNELSLKRIFTCEAGSFDFGTKKYHTVGGPAGSIKLEPIQLQSGSGTRGFWEGAVGTGACLTGNAQEHNGQAIQSNPNALVPFSISQWIAQKNSAAANQQGAVGSVGGVPVVDRRYGVKINKVGANEPLLGAIQNPSFTEALTRNVYNVIPTNLTGNPKAAELTAAFVGSSSAACTAQVNLNKVVEVFGFSLTLAKETANAGDPNAVNGKVTPVCGATNLDSLKSGYYATS